MKKENQKSNCKDYNCPVHGNLKTRGKVVVGTVVKASMNKTVTVEWSWSKKIKKYERYEKRRTKIHAHNPACIDAQVGDKVKLMECRPLSKTKNFVVIEKLS